MANPGRDGYREASSRTRARQQQAEAKKREETAKRKDRGFYANVSVRPAPRATREGVGRISRVAPRPQLHVRAGYREGKTRVEMERSAPGGKDMTIQLIRAIGPMALRIPLAPRGR
jgi:hypothetical protein